MVPVYSPIASPDGLTVTVRVVGVVACVGFTDNQFAPVDVLTVALNTAGPAGVSNGIACDCGESPTSLVKFNDSTDEIAETVRVT